MFSDTIGFYQEDDDSSSLAFKDYVLEKRCRNHIN